MGAAAYALLFVSIIGCIAYGLVNWSKEASVPPADLKDTEQDKPAV